MLKTPQFWQHKGILSTLLLPIAWLYQFISQKDLAQKAGKARKLPKPTIVVGNINMGGTGKTPATITLTKSFQERGYKVGVLSRGFGRKSTDLLIVENDVTPDLIGDEPYLIYQKTSCYMAIDTDRYKAGMALLEKHPDIDLFICDDALQHRQLERDIEVIVMGKQGFGNGRIFPAGPLREPISRLGKADVILSNNADLEILQKVTQPFIQDKIVTLKSTLLPPVNIKTQEDVDFDQFKNIAFTAVAGIAHPQNFYNMLTEKGLHFEVRSFPDHFEFTEADLSPIQSPILMTEKDATKCLNFERNDLWAVPLENKICSSFIDTLETRLNLIRSK